MVENVLNELPNNVKVKSRKRITKDLIKNIAFLMIQNSFLQLYYKITSYLHQLINILHFIVDLDKFIIETPEKSIKNTGSDNTFAPSLIDHCP